MYHHFASKEALFLAVYEVVERELLDAIGASRCRRPIREMLRLGALAFLDAAATPEYAHLAARGARGHPGEARRALSEQYGLGMVRETLRAIETEGRLSSVLSTRSRQCCSRRCTKRRRPLPTALTSSHAHRGPATHRSRDQLA